MRKELELLEKEESQLGRQEEALQLEQDRLKLLVEDAQSKKRLATLAKFKAKLRTDEEIEAKYGNGNVVSTHDPPAESSREKET